MKTIIEKSDTTKAKQKRTTKTNKEEKHKSWKHNNSNLKNRRTKQLKMKASWVWQGDVRKLVWRIEANMKKGKRQKQTEQKEQNENVISKGVDEGKITKMESWKGKLKKNKKTRRFMKKGILGNKRAKTSLQLNDSFCVSQIRTPL